MHIFSLKFKGAGANGQVGTNTTSSQIQDGSFPP